MAEIDFSAELAEAVSECQSTFGVEITLQVTTGDTENNATGVKGGGTTVSAMGLKAVRSERQGTDFGTGARVTEVEYRVAAADLGSVVPARGCSVVDGTATLKVYAVEKEARDQVWVLKCRTQKGPA